MTHDVTGGKLAAALLRAQAGLRLVEPDRETRDGARFRFVSTDGMVTACRAALHEQGLVLMPVETSCDLIGAPPTKKGDPSATLLLLRSFRLSHAESGEAVVVTAGHGCSVEHWRPLDRAYATALSMSLRDMLRDLLLVPRRDADEEDAHPVPERAPGREQAPKPAPAAQTTAKPAVDGPLAVTADDFEGAGWPADEAAELAALEGEAPMSTVIGVHKAAIDHFGEARVKSAWGKVGVGTLKGMKSMSGPVLREFALVAGGAA